MVAEFRGAFDISMIKPVPDSERRPIRGRRQTGKTVSVLPSLAEQIMRKGKLSYLAESKVVVRQGQQLWHLHQALKEKPEQDVLLEMAHGFMDTGRAASLSEGLVVAGAVITAYRSTEAGDRVPQKARERLKCQVGVQILA